jgi:hypothetical protein
LLVLVVAGDFATTELQPAALYIVAVDRIAAIFPQFVSRLLIENRPLSFMARCYF